MLNVTVFYPSPIFFKVLIERHSGLCSTQVLLDLVGFALNMTVMALLRLLTRTLTMSVA